MSGYRYPTARPSNPFRLLGPSPALIARAARAGVDTTSRPAIAAWRAAGEPPAWP